MLNPLFLPRAPSWRRRRPAPSCRPSPPPPSPSPPPPFFAAATLALSAARSMHRLVRAWQSRDTRGAIARLELCLTPCIVSHPPGACDALLNPANERLDGTQFDPSTAARTFESTIIYPAQVVDGLVTELGGTELYRVLQALPCAADGSRCATGHALATPSGGELAPTLAPPLP